MPKKAQPKYYVRPITEGGFLVGYGVYDSVHGMISEHARYMVEQYSTTPVCKHLADEHARDLNKGIK